MGRMFEKRKHTMFARFDRMAKQFARIGKDITIAVRAGGPDPDSNSVLRRVVQNGRAVNMPKDKIDAAIKRASGKDTADYAEVLYEGYAPHGVALVIETATDNTVRTVANLRTHFNKGGGHLGTDGSVTYLFRHLGSVPHSGGWHATGFGMLKAAALVATPTLADLVVAGYRPGILMQLNPFLTKKAAKELHRAALHWMQLCVLEDKLDRLLANWYAPA